MKKQASKCGFVNGADDMIIYQIVIGVWDESTRKRLLTNTKLTLKQAINEL